jgi:hypothetical protein
MASLPVRHSTALILLARAWQKPWASSWLAFSLGPNFYLLIKRISEKTGSASCEKSSLAYISNFFCIFVREI